MAPEVPHHHIRRYSRVGRGDRDAPPSGLRVSFEAGRAAGVVGVRRQVEASAAAAETWSGARIGTSSFALLVAPRVEGHDDALAHLLEDGATAASAAFEEIGSYLRSDYLPSARADDSVGVDRFGLWSRRYAGSILDEDDYEWAAVLWYRI
jgi:hypothetical protein